MTDDKASSTALPSEVPGGRSNRTRGFDLISSDGLVIDPDVWPAALSNGSVVDILLWTTGNVERPQSQPPSVGAEDENLDKEEDADITENVQNSRCRGRCRREGGNQQLREENQRLRSENDRLVADNRRLEQDERWRRQEDRRHEENAQRNAEFLRQGQEHMQEQQVHVQQLWAILSERDNNAQQRDANARARDLLADARARDIGVREEAMVRREANVFAREQLIVPHEQAARPKRTLSRTGGTSDYTSNSFLHNRRLCLSILACRAPLCSCRKL